LLPESAVAQSKQACADAYVAGQVSKKEGRLREARDRFQVCASAACPGALQRDCTPWKAQLDREIPTLTVSVKDEAGAALGAASVTVDGAPLASPAAFDPGEHTVRVEAAGMKPAEQRVTLASGEGNRAITVRLERLAAASRPVPVAPIVLGASGLVALGVFAGLGVTGNAKKASLDALGCKPDCSPSEVSAARSLYLGADVALGVGLGALVAAGVVLIVQLKAPAGAAAARFSPSPGGGAFTFQF
jgi:hypothetical protein